MIVLTKGLNNDISLYQDHSVIVRSSFIIQNLQWFFQNKFWMNYLDSDVKNCSKLFNFYHQIKIYVHLNFMYLHIKTSMN